MEKLAAPVFSSGNKELNLLVTKQELEKKKKIYGSVKLSNLPDKGAKLKNQIDELENIIRSLSLECNEERKNKNVDIDKNKEALSIKKDPVVHKENSKTRGEDSKSSESSSSYKENLLFSRISGETDKNISSFRDFVPKLEAKITPEYDTNSPSFKQYRDPGNLRKTLLTEAKPLVEKSAQACKAQNLFTSNYSSQADNECARKIHSSLATYPEDSLEADEPDNLKSSLMAHQRKGLAWMMWREEQDPRGGILADDMGLGKTLTMISLVLKQKEMSNYCSLEEEEYECRGTLIICLASIIHQWKDEIIKHCEPDALNVCVYHGPKREKNSKKMRNYDIVLTTYNILLSEKKAAEGSKIESPLYKLKWERVILDEGHTIKNHASQTAQAVFSVKGFRRWVVTGTPIHNVFKDVYSLVKFLQFSPFDDYKKFKVLTDELSESSAKRRNLLIKSILLRRTKEQLDEVGKPLIEMKKKSFHLCNVELSAEERKVYDKFNEKVSKKVNQYFEKGLKNRSSSSLLVSLLRLQQCCNHLSLFESEPEELEDSTDIACKLSSLAIDESSCDSNLSTGSSLDLTFNDLEADMIKDKSFKSSKIKALFEKLKAISDSSQGMDKSVIVSQWVSMLKVVAFHLELEDIAYHIIAGDTKVEDRQQFAQDFNYNENGAKIMLLSLKAGGTGLNLVGANHLFLLDLHWNPALEMQASDRIHRVGQKKDVTIYKFICKDTIEEKIKLLQDSKRQIAVDALRGVKQNTKGLTIDDYKILFNVGK